MHHRLSGHSFEQTGRQWKTEEPGMLQCVCMLVVQSCLTLCNPMNCSLLRLLRPWESASKSTGVSCQFLLQGIFPTEGSNLGRPHCMQILYHLSYQGSHAAVYGVAKHQTRLRDQTTATCFKDSHSIQIKHFKYHSLYKRLFLILYKINITKLKLS